jgi:hypothetical protein
VTSSSSSLYRDPKFLQHFPTYSPDCDDDDDDEYEEEEQPFSEFVEMGNRPPNEEGTGRFPLTPERRAIGLIDLTKIVTTTTTTTTTRRTGAKGNKRHKPWDWTILYTTTERRCLMNPSVNPSILAGTVCFWHLTI